MLIVDSQIHLWQNAKMSAHHRQIPTYSVDDALAEMASAGVDCAVIHPPSSLGEAVNALAVEAVRLHPDKFCILGHFDLESPDREDIVAHWRERPGMLGFRFTFNQPHQKAWWTDGSLDWFWAASEKAGLPVGLLAGGNMAALAKIAERHPAPEAAHRSPRSRGRRRRGNGRRGLCRPCRRCSRSPATPMSGSRCRALRAIRASPTRTRTSTAICARSSRRSGPSARSGAPTSPACRARTGNA